MSSYTITLSTGTEVNLKKPAAFIDLTQDEFNELVSVVKNMSTDFSRAADRAIRAFEAFEVTVTEVLNAKNEVCKS